MEYICNNSSQTRIVGKRLARQFLKISKKRALVITLDGDLGNGKTTFLQGFAKGLGIKEKVLSPTFVILRKFEILPSEHSNPQVDSFYHLDCYRIKKPKEILDMGFNEIISNSSNIVAIEWAENIKEVLPKDKISLKIEFVNKNIRKIILKNNG
jgi:tRNA threonylcarbamoyladenosine biosynthesis protein TsaE